MVSAGRLFHGGRVPVSTFLFNSLPHIRYKVEERGDSLSHSLKFGNVVPRREWSTDVVDFQTPSERVRLLSDQKMEPSHMNSRAGRLFQGGSGPSI
jgi:hypothetical protein